GEVMGGRLWHPCAAASGVWVRGSFHGHCRESSRCATVPLAAGVAEYRRLGAAFIAVTDHDRVTDLAALRQEYPDIIFLEGFEYSTRENMAFVGEQVPPLYELPLEEALCRAGDAIVTIACHPRPHAAGPEYWSLEKLSELGTWPDGIEVYNGHYGTEVALSHGRQPLGTHLWDEALTAGRRLWGYANDDFHDPEDLGNAWNMVHVEATAGATSVTAAALVQAAKAGRCYGTTGLLLRGFEVEGERLSIELAAPAQGAFIGPGGRALCRGEGTRFEYRHQGEPHVRFEAEGGAGRIFLQPAFAGG
ncbi:MAG: hypothetical protein ABIL09_22445, partial [Gemmatimonadota bacterium]